MTTRNADHWIKTLALVPHPEGGHYRQTYRAQLTIPHHALPSAFSGDRPVSTAIYFLLGDSDFSAFHRLRSDEMWHFYAGGAIAIHVLAEDGQYSQIFLGADSEAKEVFQAVVKAGCWFASELRDKNSFALVGCTVSPGFDFADFEMGARADLTARFPQHKKLIERLTR
jgi:predicted cupin superfamily sugar epimerase